MTRLDELPKMCFDVKYLVFVFCMPGFACSALEGIACNVLKARMTKIVAEKNDKNICKNTESLRNDVIAWDVVSGDVCLLYTEVLWQLEMTKFLGEILEMELSTGSGGNPINGE